MAIEDDDKLRAVIQRALLDMPWDDAGPPNVFDFADEIADVVLEAIRKSQAGE